MRCLLLKTFTHILNALEKAIYQNIGLNTGQNYCNAEVSVVGAFRSDQKFISLASGRRAESYKSRRKFTPRVPRESLSVRIVTCFLMSVTAGVIIVRRCLVYRGHSNKRGAVTRGV